jgi:hypothetical protein
MTRTYLDFNTIEECVQSILQMFEQHLRRSNPDSKTPHETINYELPLLVEYLDNIADLSCMVYNDVQKVYLPHGLDWIKSRVYMSLKKVAKKIENCDDQAE